MAYEILIESEDEQDAPPTSPLLRLAYTGPGNGHPGVVHVCIGKVDETHTTRTFTVESTVTVNANEFIKALTALGPIQALRALVTE